MLQALMTKKKKKLPPHTGAIRLQSHCTNTLLLTNLRTCTAVTFTTRVCLFNTVIILFGDREKPDVVFFQELVPETFSYIEDKLPEYMCIAGNTADYFTATLLRKFTVYYDSHNIIQHAGSQMMRNLLTVEVITTDVIFHLLCM
jgi:hypothetical protein